MNYGLETIGEEVENIGGKDVEKVAYNSHK